LFANLLAQAFRCQSTRKKPLLWSRHLDFLWREDLLRGQPCLSFRFSWLLSFLRLRCVRLPEAPPLRPVVVRTFPLILYCTFLLLRCPVCGIVCRR